MATHSSIYTWRIAMDRGAWGSYSPWGRRVGYDWATLTFGHLVYTILLMKVTVMLLVNFAFGSIYTWNWASQVVQWARNLPTMQEMQETWVWFLCREDPLEEGMATHSSILAGECHGQEEPDGLHEVERVGHYWSDWAGTHRITVFSYVLVYVTFCFISYSLQTIEKSSIKTAFWHFRMLLVLLLNHPYVLLLV